MWSKTVALFFTGFSVVALANKPTSYKISCDEISSKDVTLKNLGFEVPTPTEKSGNFKAHIRSESGYKYISPYLSSGFNMQSDEEGNTYIVPMNEHLQTIGDSYVDDDLISFNYTDATFNTGYSANFYSESLDRNVTLLAIVEKKPVTAQVMFRLDRTEQDSGLNFVTCKIEE